MNTIERDRVDAILHFWFGAPDSDTFGRPRRIWFRSTPEFDRQIQTHFTRDIEDAATGNRHHWRAQSRSCLALLLLLDQFPRNLFRGHPRAYATDDRALATAIWALDRQYDRQLLPVQRTFIYLPFEHSENQTHQDRAVRLFQALADEQHNPRLVRSALHHQDIIRRFGRFPHRNAILARSSTAEELAFLERSEAHF